MAQSVSRAEFERLDHQVNGNGQPGIRQDVSAIRTTLSEMKGAEVEREKAQQARHEENQEKLSNLTVKLGQRSLLMNIAMVAVTLAGVLAAIFFGVMTLKANHIGDLQKILLSHQTPSVYAVVKESQDAGSTIAPHY